MKYLAWILASSLVLVGRAQAQQLPPDQEQLLLPIAPDHTFGAFGSLWETDLAIANGAGAPITVFGLEQFCPVQCSTTPGPIPAHTTIFAPPVDNCFPAGPHILITDATTAGSLFFTLRSRDTSRDDRAWGSIVPVVRARDRFTSSFSIVDVPVGPQFRALLRLYAMTPTLPSAVTVRFLKVAHPGADSLISEMRPALATPPAQSAPYCPAYAQIPLSGDPSLINAGRIRIEVVPTNASDHVQQYWGFVSVTNNDTQEVSIIAPR